MHDYMVFQQQSFSGIHIEDLSTEGWELGEGVASRYLVMATTFRLPENVE